MLRKKHYWCVSWDKTKALIYFKISQCEFLSVETAQIYILSRTRLKPCLWNPGYMYLKYSVFNTPTFRIKMMKNWFVLMIQWLTHTSLVSLMDESVFLNESRMNDSITNTFLTVTCRHLVEKWCNRHKRYLKRQLLSKDEWLYFDRYHRHQCL